MNNNNSMDLAQQMRQGMRRLASGVSVITGRNNEGHRSAMTASSVTSVSDDPPSLLVCVHQESYLGTAIKETASFAVNLLSSAQQEISVRCATPDEELDRFALGNWVLNDKHQLYVLEDAQAVFLCELKREMVYGTHFIFVGDILSVQIAQQEVDPLVYLNGNYVKAAKSQ